MKCPRPPLPAAALALHLLTLLPFLLHAHAAPSDSAAITAAPPLESLSASAEASTHAARLAAHSADVAAGRDVAYVALLKGKDFGTDASLLSVRINGAAATDVLLHNSTAFSFRVPTSMVLDRALMRSSFVEIAVGTVRHVKIPLSVLEPAISKVRLPDFRREIERQREEAERRAGAGHADVDTGSDPASEKDDYDFDPYLDEDTLEEDDGVDEGAWEEPDVDEDTPPEDGPAASSVPEEPGIEKPLEADDPEAATGVSTTDELVSNAEQLLTEGTRASTNKAVRALEDAVEKGDVRAMTIYGLALLSGSAVGLWRNIALAVTHLQAASDKGYPDAQAMLGFLYASGIAGTALRKDIGAALLMWTFAAEGGSMYAKMALGYRYFTGTDIAEDCEKASEYYKEVADEVFEEAKESLDRQTGRQREKGSDDDDSMAEIRPPTPNAMLTSDRKRLAEGMTQRVLGEANEVVQYYRHSADRGDPSAQVVMGNLYYYGAIDMPQDIDRARQLFTLAAKAGRAEAHAHLGYMDLRAGSIATAVDHLKIAADRDDKLGLHGMGFVTLHGIGVPKDERKAAKYFTKAIDKDHPHPEAMFNLAIMYSKGVGVPHSPQEAFRYFQAAARYGHMQSNYHVGVMMLRGESPAKKDCTMATQYLKWVSQQGVWNKILSRAFRAYERGFYADALFRYLQAAHAGIELAQFNAAFMYEHDTLSNVDGFSLKGWGLKDSELRKMHSDRGAVVEEALELYQMSASQGHSDSMVRMGDLVFGETKDFVRAASAYERAVKLRNAEAMFNLGWMHARGFGMNADKHMAKRYFDQAKDTDQDAFLPATIAVYSLKYSESLLACVDKVSTAMDRVRWFSNRGLHDDEWDVEISVGAADVVALIVLFLVLVSVVYMRQRRMAVNRVRGQTGNGEGEGHNREQGTEGVRAGLEGREERNEHNPERRPHQD